MGQVQEVVEGLFQAEPSAPRIEESIDLWSDAPVVDLREQRIDLDFRVAPQPAGQRDPQAVIDLRDPSGPTIEVGDATPVLRFDAGPPAAGDDEAVPTELALPTVGMWARPDRCLPMLVNRARWRQGGVAAVSKERTDLTELAVLVSRRGDVDARRLARLARTCR